jgi:hypothetical protein
MHLRAAAIRVLAWAVLALGLGARAGVVNYDIVYVRAPRFGDNENSLWPEVFHPARMDAGADLMLWHPDGTEERLVAGGKGSVTDPFISFDAQWCYYALFPNLQPAGLNGQRADLPYEGADIYRINLKTRQIQRLTFQEFTPNTGCGNWLESNPVNPPAAYDRLGYGILNMAPCPVAGGKVAFVSNRNGFMPPHDYTAPTLQLFVMDEDGENVTWIGTLNVGSALHPTPLADGRLMFTSYESQGLRDIRMWGIWTIYPDGRYWEPLVSAFHEGQAFHFMTQLSDGDVVVVDYYNLNNNGFGALYRVPIQPPAGQPAFYSAFPKDNPPIAQTVGAGYSYPFTMPFTRRGMYSITPFTHGQDESAPIGTNGVRVGKFTHPSAAPNNDLLVVWSPGPANEQNRPSPTPYFDGGIYLIPGGNAIHSPTELVKIKNDPGYNEAWPRAVVPYADVHGVAEPAQIPWLPNDGTLHPDLPAGTPFGIIGTSSFYKRESFPGEVPPWANQFDGLDAFNTSENGQSSNWFTQGSDDGKYSNSDIWAVRILAMEPATHLSYGPHIGQHFQSHANERLRILGEIPLRKFKADSSPVLDPDGNPDTSFMARMPSDTPFTFQMLDTNGMVLTMAQTWHQLRPGEVRNNCGGCHAHSQEPLDIATTYAGRNDYKPVDLASVRTTLSKDASGKLIAVTNKPGALNVEFYRDIRPLLQKSCTACHSKTNSLNPGNLVLDDYALYSGVPGDYARLAADNEARWGYPPLVKVGKPVWRQSNASRYVRMFQSRRSLLIWKVFGKRLDGWTNADHPTESVPGDASTLPKGTDINACDLDYTGDIMPPPGSKVPPLTEDEKLTFARWVDLGCPINLDENGPAKDYGWFMDNMRPTLTISSPRQNGTSTPLSEIRVGVADAYKGVRAGSLSIKADFAVNGMAPNTELVSQGSWVDQGVFSISLNEPIKQVAYGHVTASAYDEQGNRTTSNVRFWIDPPTLRVMRLEPSAPNRLRLLFEEPYSPSEHVVLASAAIHAPLSRWQTLTNIGNETLSGVQGQIEVELPADSKTLFLKLKRK